MTRPKRTTFLPFAMPDVGQAELAVIKEAIDSGWLTSGPKVRQFEEAFAAAVGTRYAVAVNSATAAMHLSLAAIGLQADEEVITTPYTFASSAEVIRYLGAKPVLVDVVPETLNIDPQLIEAAITPSTQAILPVHIAGLPADLDAIYDIAERHNLAVVEDAAHAFPTQYKGRMIGSPSGAVGHNGTATKSSICFSFYATKAITTGEGGMLCTDDEDLNDRCRLLALHGISRDAWKRYTAEDSWYYEIVAPGFKYNMTDVAAAMGLAQLERSEAMWQRRGAIAQHYTTAFQNIIELQAPLAPEEHQHAWYLYMLRLNLDRLSIDRAQFIKELKLRNIGSSVHFIPLHIHPYYRDANGYRPEDFPVAYGEYQREISLPIFSKMSAEDTQDVIAAVLDIVKNFRR